jgi:hypothetical protein
MCQKCVDAVKEIYPDCPEEVMGDFLFSATAFPFGNGDLVRKQLLEAKSKGYSTYLEAISYANSKTSEAMGQTYPPKVNEGRED